MNEINILPKDKFLWEKTSLSEVAPRPSTFTFDLLKQVYSDNGPIARVWRQHGIKYFNTDFLRLVEGDLYVDREKELQSLFPAMSLLNNSLFKPKLFRVKGILRTARNTFCFLFLSSKNFEALQEKLSTALYKNLNETKNLDEALKDFLTDYEIVFAINLLAETALSSLQATLAFDHLNIVDVLNIENDETLKKIGNWLPPQDILTGNSLEITDVSPFVPGQPPQQTKTIAEVLKNIPTWKQPLLIKRLQLAQTGERLREYGRWLMLRHINRLRPLVKVETPKPASRLLPTRLSHLVETKEKKKSLGVSAGLARGVLVSKETLSKTLRPRILYHPMINPDLVQYLSSIDGIISEQGSLLSHLAIVAREQKVPVVVNFSLTDSGLTFGDQIEINGSTGEWQKI
ncbi:MAG: PEP-utilizing enzyme [Candidatus Uhrbacteria bacterium]